MLGYKDIDAVNFSTLKYMAVSPKEYLYRLNKPVEPTKAMMKGSAFHCKLLTPNCFDLEYVCKDEAKKGDNRTVLSSADWEDVHEMAAAVYDEGVWIDKYSVVEEVLLWTDTDTGISCKCRVDAICSAGGYDEFKSVSSTYLEPRRFMKQYEDMLYHSQAAMYHDALLANGYDPCPVTCYSVVQTAPYDVVEWEVPHWVIEDGRDLYKSWLFELKQCRETGVFPGISRNQRMTMVIPRYKSLKRGEEE